MSTMSSNNNAKLGEIIKHLESLDPAMAVENGFGNPHSYRGYYEDLAFSPRSNTTVGKMLKAAKSALNAPFTGYKGGEFEMTETTDCWLAEYGSCGIPIWLPDETPQGYFLPK